MASGVPLVATTGGALPEVAGQDGETALLAGAASGALAAVVDVFDDPDLQARVGAAAVRAVITRWSWRHTAEATVEHYRAPGSPGAGAG